MFPVHLSGCAYICLYLWAAYQTYKWSRGYKTRALWYVIYAWGRIKSLAFWWLERGRKRSYKENGAPSTMIMSPTGLMTLPILDPNSSGMKMSFASFTLQCVKYSLIVGNSAVVTQVHRALKSPAFSLLYCMASLVVYGWSQTSEHAAEFACPFNVT